MFLSALDLPVGMMGLGDDTVSPSDAADVVWSSMPSYVNRFTLPAVAKMSVSEFKTKVADALSGRYRLVKAGSVPKNNVSDDVLIKISPDNAGAITSALDTMRGNGYYVVSTLDVGTAWVRKSQFTPEPIPAPQGTLNKISEAITSFISEPTSSASKEYDPSIGTEWIRKAQGISTEWAGTSVGTEWVKKAQSTPEWYKKPQFVPDLPTRTASGNVTGNAEFSWPPTLVKLADKLTAEASTAASNFFSVVAQTVAGKPTGAPAVVENNYTPPVRGRDPGTANVNTGNTTSGNTARYKPSTFTEEINAVVASAVSFITPFATAKQQRNQAAAARRGRTGVVVKGSDNTMTYVYIGGGVLLLAGLVYFAAKD